MTAEGRRRWAVTTPSVVWVMLVGIAVRLVWIPLGSGTARFLTPDSSSYLAFAERLPGVLTNPGVGGLAPSLQRTPGYPLVLWLLSFGGSVEPTVVVVVQCLIGGGLTVWWCWHLTRRWFGPSAALWAATVVALDPVSVGHSLQIGTETVFTAGLIGAVALLDRCVTDDATSPAVLGSMCGLAIGGLALVRPVMLYFAPVAAVMVWIVQRRRVGATARPGARRIIAPAALMVSAGLLVGLWTVRNELVAGRWVFSTAQGQNLFEYGAAARAADEDGQRLWPGGDDDSRSDLESAKRRLVAANDDVVRGADLSDPIVQSDVWTEIGWRGIRAHPGGFAEVAVAATVRTLAGPGHTQLATIGGGSNRGIAVISAVLLAIEYLAAGVGAVWCVLARRRRVLVLLATPALYLLVLGAGPQATARFRVPLVPLVAVLAGVGICQVIARSTGTRRAPAGERPA